MRDGPPGVGVPGHVDMPDDEDPTSISTPEAEETRPEDPAVVSPGSLSESVGRRAGKNTVVRAVGEVVGKLASLVLFAALARAVGQGGVGIFVFGFAYMQIVTMPVGLGLDRLLIRRVARDRSRLTELMDVLAVKIVVGIPVALLGILAIVLLGYDPTTIATVALLAPGLLADSFARSVFGIFTAHEQSGLLSLSLVVQRVLAAALGLGALALGYGVVAIAVTFTAGTVAGLLMACALAARRIGLPPVTTSPQQWRLLTGQSLPFAVQDIFGVLLAKLDVVILALLAADAAVGRYGGAYRLLEATFFLSSSVNGAFAAMYSYLGPTTDPPVGAVAQRSIKLLLFLLVPCAVSMGVLAGPITVLFLGEGFREAAVSVRLLAPAVVLMGLVYLATSVVVSRGNPRRLVKLTAGAVALNVTLNFMLIPTLAERGAAAAMVLTEIALAAVLLRLVVRSVGRLRWASMLAGPVLAGIAMGVAMLPLADTLVPALPLGGSVYLLALVAIECAIDPSDFRFVARLLRKRLALRPMR